MLEEKIYRQVGSRVWKWLGWKCSQVDRGAWPGEQDVLPGPSLEWRGRSGWVEKLDESQKRHEGWCWQVEHALVGAMAIDCGVHEWED